MKNPFLQLLRQSIMIASAFLFASCDFVDSVFFKGTYEAVERCAERNTSSFTPLFEARSGCAKKHQFLMEDTSGISIRWTFYQTSSDVLVLGIIVENNSDMFVFTEVDFQIITQELSLTLDLKAEDLWVEPGRVERKNFYEADLNDIILEKSKSVGWRSSKFFGKQIIPASEISIKNIFRRKVSGIRAKQY